MKNKQNWIAISESIKNKTKLYNFHSQIKYFSCERCFWCWLNFDKTENLFHYFLYCYITHAQAHVSCSTSGNKLSTTQSVLYAKSALVFFFVSAFLYVIFILFIFIHFAIHFVQLFFLFVYAMVYCASKAKCSRYWDKFNAKYGVKTFISFIHSTTHICYYSILFSFLIYRK